MRVFISIIALTLLLACSRTAVPPPVDTPPPVVSPPSLPPGIDKTITAEEGTLVSLDVQAFDPDGDPLTLTYSPPFNAEGQWQTDIGDAGTYTITVTASDGELITEKQIQVIVEPKNKPPRISPIPDVRIRVGDTIRFEPEVVDPNGDAVTLTYSGWMTAAERSATAADLGPQQVTITASDGALVDSRTITITVLPQNNPPQIDPIAPFSVFEGDTIALNPQVRDADGDNLTITYSGWMADRTAVASYEDAGTHEVLITVSDGIESAVQRVVITVKDRPRAPEIVLG